MIASDIAFVYLEMCKWVGRLRYRTALLYVEGLSSISSVSRGNFEQILMHLLLEGLIVALLWI